MLTNLSVDLRGGGRLVLLLLDDDSDGADTDFGLLSMYLFDFSVTVVSL